MNYVRIIRVTISPSVYVSKLAREFAMPRVSFDATASFISKPQRSKSRDAESSVVRVKKKKKLLSSRVSRLLSCLKEDIRCEERFTKEREREKTILIKLIECTFNMIHVMNA